MDKMLVAVFESEKRASEVARALHELHMEGSVFVYALAVILKGFKKIDVMEFIGGQAILDPVLGTATRSLIKLLEEPLSFIDDSESGPSIDWKNDLANASVDGYFLNQVSCHLVSGRAAIVSEIEEEKPTPISELLESQGGIVSRCVRREVVDTQIAEELDALRREIKILEEQRLHTLDESKAELQAKLNLTKARLQATKHRAKHYAESIKHEAEAKIASLQERAATTEGGIKARIERLTNEVRANYANRATKMNLAWQIGGDVL